MALPDYLQDTGKDLARQMTATYSAPLDTSTFMGSQFVAGQDPAQTAAYNLATQTGLGSYKPQLQAAQTAAYEPYGRLSQYGTGITGLAGGVAGMQYQTPQAQDPWATALGTALGIGGLYGKIFGFPGDN